MLVSRSPSMHGIGHAASGREAPRKLHPLRRYLYAGNFRVGLPAVLCQDIGLVDGMGRRAESSAMVVSGVPAGNAGLVRASQTPSTVRIRYS
ncbi:hypothetical protein Bxe_C0254 [Paraburkholderia xenovorans LB400]|uniref:Uncharacterized protein n=1 Tax=Paraburkholderia xenovorans (strain LB400) TaxID=266265 RepID=Q13IB1_PARXL|nr:hypothetical protein Bxe_C0254 [Paraburkholderia xenovorans LB400]